MGQFRDPPCQLLQQTVFHGTESELFINFTVGMYNSAPISMLNMGVLNMTLLVWPPPLGVTTL